MAAVGATWRMGMGSRFGAPPQPPAESLAHVYLEQLPVKLDPAAMTHVSYDDGNELVLMATPTTLRAWPVRRGVVGGSSQVGVQCPPCQSAESRNLNKGGR